MAMATEFSVLVTHPTRLDYQCFRLWIKGHTVEDAVNRWAPPKQGSQMIIPSRAYADFVRNQYRMFELLEPYLEQPTGEEGRVPVFTEQMLVRLPAHVQTAVIDGYYSMDDAIAREIMGKKLSTRLRKDLEELAEELGSITVPSCRRQFDNIKRIYRAVEDVDGSLPEIIRQMFLLSPELSRRYASMIFAISNRLDASRKKLSALTYQDVDYCAGVFMEHWTGEAAGEMTADLDPAFLRDIAEVKAMVTGLSETIDEYRNYICVAFEQAGRAGVANRAHIKHMIRAVVQIGAGLRLEKEFRDILVDMLEKLIEPSKKLGWTASDIELFFTAFTEKFRVLHTIEVSNRDRFNYTVERFARGLRIAAVRIYRAV